jgi:mutual gliding-motility protein MglA
MPYVNHATKTVHFKVVYWGPEAAGRSTSVSLVVDAHHVPMRGPCLELDIPPADQINEEVRTSLTVRGAQMYVTLMAARRGAHRATLLQRLLPGADAIVFVADSQRHRMDDNVAALDELARAGETLTKIPRVLQLNKRDLPDAVPVAECEALLSRGSVAVIEASAKMRSSVFEAFKEALRGPVLRARAPGVVVLGRL